MALNNEHIAFMRWSESQGININGVAPAYIPGRRLGMVATRRIHAGETMLTVPLSAMFTIDSIPISFVQLFSEGTSFHAILAAFLTHGDPILLEKWELWRQVWPSRHEFEETLPIFWSKASPVDKSLLPPSVSGSWSLFKKRAVDTAYEHRYTNILSHQVKRLQDAWKVVVSVLPDTNWDIFSYHWLILNTRSFYYVSPGKSEPEDWNDAIALVPFADYFNHDDNAPCEVDFDGQAYTFKASQQFEKGEELFMSYGSHPNDFLLVEYGFSLDNNESDAIYLDDIVYRELTAAHKKELRSQQLYGNYKVTWSGVCHRTKAVACIQYMTSRQWRNYILGRIQDEENKTTSILHDWIDTYLKESITKIETFNDIQMEQQSETRVNENVKIDILLKRWIQIRTLCEDALKAISS